MTNSKYPNIDRFNPRTCMSNKVKRLHRITANIFRKYLQPFNITDSQLTMLFVLSKMGGLTQKQLSDIMVLEKSSLNRNLTRMFDRNYLTKENFPTIEMTEEGKEMVNRIIPEWEKAMNEMRMILNEDGEEGLNLVLNKLLTKNK